MENLTPEESIRKAEEMQGAQDQEWDPRRNPEAISMIRQKDGNWKLWGQRFGKMVELRAGKPEDLIGGFLTHE